MGTEGLVADTVVGKEMRHKPRWTMRHKPRQVFALQPFLKVRFAQTSPFDQKDVFVLCRPDQYERYHDGDSVVVKAHRLGSTGRMRCKRILD